MCNNPGAAFALMHLAALCHTRANPRLKRFVPKRLHAAPANGFSSIIPEFPSFAHLMNLQDKGVHFS
jgi:hypothetical protein